MDVVIQKAMKLWGYPENTMYSLLAERENKVYLIEPLESQSFVMRIHRKQYRSNVELDSELQWMAYLASQKMSVPKPLESTQGTFRLTVDNWEVDCLTLLDGIPLGSTGQALKLKDRTGTFHSIGQTMANLHQLTDVWQIPKGFYRQEWNTEGLLGEQPLWGRFWDNPQLSSKQSSLLKAARMKAIKTLSEMVEYLDYGLIHADMVRENIFIKSDEIQLLDFDDSTFGFRLFEVATALFKNRDEEDYEDLEKALINGYQDIRPLNIEYLSLFMLLRACTYVGWIITRLDEPNSKQRCERYISNAVLLAEEFISE